MSSTEPADIPKSITPKDNISYVFKAADSPLHIIKSQAYYLTNLFECSTDDLTSLLIESVEIENKILDSLFEPVIDFSYHHKFTVEHDRLKLSNSQVFKIKNTNIILYQSQMGWICKKINFLKIKEIIENWKLTPDAYNAKSLEKVFWTEKTLSLKRDIEFFSMSKKWFDQKDLPYSRSYLLYGPPGNGKTSVIRAISDFFCSKPESFSFTGKYDDPDTAFQKWIIGKESNRNEMEDSILDSFYRPRKLEQENYETNPRIRILLLEDIDRFFSKEETVKLPVSFSTLLNSLDGVFQRKNSIIIATANNPEKIDSQVLCRPGRFDLRIPFEAPSESVIREFIKKISDGDHLTDESLDFVTTVCKGHSLSFAKGIYLSAANRAFLRSSLIINDEDMILSAKEFSSNLGKEIKSIKSGAGF